jgi:hypothetical protein
MKANLILSVFILIFSLSCKESSKTDEKTIKIDLTKVDNPSCGDIFSKIEIIPLETSPNCLINGIEKNVFFRGRYYLMDRDELSVLVFDEKGKFCFKIKNIGEGPGEYTMLHDFEINRFTNQIEILTANPARIICFDLEGNYLKEFRFPKGILSPTKFSTISKDSALIFCQTDSHRLFSFDKKNVSIKDLNHHIPNPASLSFDPLPFGLYISFFGQNGQIIYHETLTNNVYRYENEQITLKYRWDFGKYNFDVDKLLKNQPTKYYIDLLENSNFAWHFYYNVENDKYIVTNFIFKKKAYCLFYNKTTKNYKLITGFKEGGFPPNSPITFDKGLIGIIHPTMITTFFPDGCLPAETQKKIESMDEENNPVLVKCYFNESSM